MVTIEFKAQADIFFPTPVRVELGTDSIPASHSLLLKPFSGGPAVPAQWDNGALVFIVNGMAAGQIARFELQESPQATHGIGLEEKAGGLALQLPEGPFSTYHYGAELVRPFFWPIVGPGQKQVTRAYPMEQRSDEGTDHEHQRSLWTAYEEVNDSCNWHEREGHGYMRHREFLAREQGGVFGGFTARITWSNQNDRPVMDEIRTIRLYNAGEDCRLLDYDVTWNAAYEDIEFGDTKEAGVLSIRVATSMEGKNGGLITNSEGGQGEAACWGKPASWCAYSGMAGEEMTGISVFDHPDNPNHPTRWHVRDYGLFATNPFSTEAFNAGAPTPYHLPKGSSLRFRYRILIHKGAAVREEMHSAFRDFASMPTGKVALT